ncbi:MAG: hypothetical protein IKY44_02585, partial [Clostridia bacterium]|nr:hypothetical protein [Clostridia bacterium]
ATRLDIQELSPSNENVLLSGTITDAKDLEALKSGYLNVVTFDSAYGSNHNVAAPVIEVKFSLSDKAAEGDENDTPVTGDPTTTKTSAKLFPICAYNSAAGYNAVEAEGYETKTYSGDVKNLAEGKAGHLTGTASKYSVGVYNAEDKNDTIYYSFNLSDYTKNNGYTIKSVTISYTLEGNPYYSKESVGVNVLMSGNQYWEAKTDAPAKGSMVNVESFSLSKGQKIEGEITISADTQSKLINYINNLGGLTIGFENTASNPHYYFLSTMPTITVVYEKATNVDVEPGAITGVGIRTDKDYGDLVDDWTELGTEVKDTVTLGDLTFTADKPKYANSVSTSNNGFSDASGTAEAKRNYMTVVAGFDVYGAVREQLLTELQKTNKDVRIRSIQINSASITIAALYADSGATGVDATLYIHSSAQSSTISNGSQLTSSNGTQIGDSFVPTSTSSQKHTYENVDLSGVNFSDDTPYLWTRVEGGQTTSGSWMNQKTYTVYVGVPQLSNISVSYVADVIPKDDGGDEPVQIPDPEFTTDVTKSNGKATITVTTNEPYKYIKIGDTPLSNPSAGQNGVNVFTYQVDVLEDDVTYTVSASVDGTTFSDKTTTVTVTGTGPIVAPPTEGIPEGYEWYATPVKDVTGNTTIALESGYYANNNNKEQETNKSSNGYTTYWNSATQGTSISNAYGLIANYNVGNTFESIKTPIYNSYLSDYKPEDGYLIDVEVSVSSATMTTTARSNGYSFTFYAIAASSAFDAYHSSMKSGVTTTATSTNTTSGSGKLLTVSFSSLPEITSNNKYLTLYYGASQYNANYSIYNMLSGMTLNYTYTVNIYKEQVKDPIRDVTVSEPTLDNSTITFTVTTEPTHTKVKIGSQTISSYQVVNDKNVFTYTIEAPSVNTSYKVSAALNGVFDTEYERTVEVEGFDPEPLQSVTNNATDTTVTFNISTYKTYKYVKVVNASTGTEYPEPNFVKDGNLNIFQVAVPAPDDDTIYIVYASKDGVNYDERTVEVKVKGTKVVVQDKVINATGNFFTNLNTGYADTITGPTYDDVREITTITNTESNKDTYNYNNLGSTVSGYIVGANNSSYYSKDSNNYFTSTRRNTGSPIANTAIKAGYSTFPVSYLGYAYINYDLSGTFDKLESSTDSGYKRDESASREGLIVEYRTRTETVISDIKVNYVRAQEGYVGGWANRYTVSGASFVTAGSKVADGAQLPTGGYQSLGDGSVSTSMANIGAASSLNSQQMADAKNSENVTVWVKNTGCDW